MAKFAVSGGIFYHSLRRAGYKLTFLPRDTVMVAFGILNFVTANSYHLALFEGTGTFTPEWTTFLG